MLKKKNGFVCTGNTVDGYVKMTDVVKKGKQKAH